MFRKTLGVWLSIEPELTMNLNFKGKVEKVQNGLAESKTKPTWRNHYIKKPSRLPPFLLYKEGRRGVFFMMRD